MPFDKQRDDVPKEFKVSFQFKDPKNKSCLQQITFSHPLSNSELTYAKNVQNLNLRMLRNKEGLHAPLKFAMEINAAKQIGHLPFLPSSNAQLDILLGRDDIIEYTDLFGTAEFDEIIRQPHAVMEKVLGIL